MLKFIHITDIHLVEQQQIAQVENAGLDLGKIQILAVPQRIGTSVVEKGALAIGLNGEDVGIARFSLRGRLQVLGVDFVLGTVFLDRGAHGIFPD